MYYVQGECIDVQSSLYFSGTILDPHPASERVKGQSIEAMAAYAYDACFTWMEVGRAVVGVAKAAAATAKKKGLQ